MPVEPNTITVRLNPAHVEEMEETLSVDHQIMLTINVKIMSAYRITLEISRRDRTGSVHRRIPRRCFNPERPAASLQIILDLYAANGANVSSSKIVRPPKPECGRMELESE